MNRTLLALLGLVALLAGCGAGAQDAEVATQVAAGIAATQAVEREVATLVAATLQAVASPTTAMVAPAPTEPLVASPSVEATLQPTVPPADTATPSASPSPTTPADTATPTPTPPPVVAGVPFGGSTEGLEGEVLAPGRADVPAFPEPYTGILAFRVAVRDPAVGDADGAGIAQVDFFLYRVDPEGTQTEVYQRTELNAPYCMFSGDDPSCNPIELLSGATLPNGEPLLPGQYHVEIAVVPLNSNKFAFWNFDFVVELR
jgi:hypothetical protein